MDIIFVIYFDNEMYKDNNRKCAYLKEGNAKQVITSESRRVAHDMFYEAKTNQCWYDIGEENKQAWLDKAKARFEIREFAELLKENKEEN